MPVAIPPVTPMTNRSVHCGTDSSAGGKLFPSLIGGIEFALDTLVLDSQPGERVDVRFDAGDRKRVAQFVELAFQLARCPARRS